MVVFIFAAYTALHMVNVKVGSNAHRGTVDWEFEVLCVSTVICLRWWCTGDSLLRVYQTTPSLCYSCEVNVWA